MAGSQKASRSENKTIDPSHTLYIHHSDQPGHVLVPIKLNGVNYQSWSKTVIHALTAKKKIGFVDGTVEEPSQEDEPFMFEQWNQCNSMILSWLTHAVESDIAEGIIHAKNSTRSKSIATHVARNDDSSCIFYKRSKPYGTSLRPYRSPLTCNQQQAHLEQREEDRLMQFLMGLNESYKAVRSNILMMSPLPNVRQAYSLIVQEEMQRQVSSEPTENFSIAAAVPGKRGHTEDRCRLKNGSNNKTDNSEDNVLLVVGTALSKRDRIPGNVAMDHIVSHMSLFTDLKPSNVTTDLVSGKMIGSGKQRGGLYYMHPSTNKLVVFHVSQPSDLWHLRLAVYMINRIPTPLLSNKSPFEVLYNRPPSLTHLRVSGCECYVTNVHPKQKFDPRASICFFLGIHMEKKAINSSQSQQHSPSLPLPLPISFDSTPQPISLPRFFPSSTPPLSHHNPVSSPPSSNTDVPEPLSPESVASPLPSSPSPSSLSSPPSVPSVPSNTSAPSPTHEPPLRCSTRHIQPPAWHHDYAMSAQLNHFSTQSSSRQAQTEPSSFEQVDCDPRWRQAMSTELQALERNNTWEMVPLPPRHKPIGCRWVYKIKYHFDGTIECYKARLVAKGYTQVAGIDYQETFSPTTKLTTLRCLLTVAASRNWYIHQLDVHNAFLHGNLQEEVYMTPPPATVKSAGYIQSKADYSLFTKSQGNKFTAILIYVDDILLIGNDLHEIKMLKTHLLKRFFIKDLGLTGVKPEKFPMEQNLKLTDEDGVLLHDPSRPRKPHWEAALRVLRYIKGSPGQGLFLPSENNLTLSAFCDSDWGGCPEAEYRAMANTCLELTWLRYILKDLKVELDKPAPLFCDNQAALYIAANPVFHEHTKHIEIDGHIVREKLQAGVIRPCYVSTKMQLADVFTKALGREQFKFLCTKLGVLDLHSPT
ncbi:Retrovirus-related Pol polyprotein from transposon RE1 [Vitis vinifera]|uniref:Retrovirus-related Pol polyprotein from transposon RE1 n=1 Tax=Vitis vinifera TaxID=29760 RepID=A0A438BVT5_VITVI|nr:Retrovirus-related Pol polyprotein from transposon RE1 [Vitis vinifera]